MIFAHCSLYFGHLREKRSEKFYYRFCCHVKQCLTVRQQKNFQEVVYVRCLKWCKCRSGCSKVDPCGALRTTQNVTSLASQLSSLERKETPTWRNIVSPVGRSWQVILPLKLIEGAVFYLPNIGDTIIWQNERHTSWIWMSNIATFSSCCFGWRCDVVFSFDSSQKDSVKLLTSIEHCD